MATIKLKGSLDIEKVYINNVECPNCEKKTNFHMKRPVTMKVCPHCSRVTFTFTITPITGYVNISCIAVNGFLPIAIEINSTDVEIVE